MSIHKRPSVGPEQHYEPDQFLHHIDDPVMVARRLHSPGRVERLKRLRHV
jgi:hypothetical protein